MVNPKFDSLLNEVRESETKKMSFVFGDWVLDSGNYRLTLTHNMNTTTPNVAILEGVNVIQVNLIEVINANTLRLWVTGTPDLRFNGTASITKA
jgi:hypothetical protein